MQSTSRPMIFVFATCWLGACITLAWSESVNHQVNYNKINEYLESRLGKSSAEEQAIAIASDRLKTLEKENSGSLADSLRLFISLNQLNDPSTCNERGYRILYENNRALTGLARYGIRAIDRVALKYAQDHANICCGKYEEVYSRKKDQMSANNLELVRSFARTITNYALDRDDYPNSFRARDLEEVLKSSPINYIRLMDDGQDRRRNRDIEAVVLREYLRELTGDERLTEDSVRSAYAKYLEQPCKEYVDTIGPDVFEPVVLDEITRLDSRGRVGDCNEGTMDYRFGLAYHKLCQMYILGKDNLLSHVIKSVN